MHKSWNALCICTNVCICNGWMPCICDDQTYLIYHLTITWYDAETEKLIEITVRTTVAWTYSPLGRHAWGIVQSSILHQIQRAIRHVSALSWVVIQVCTLMYANKIIPQYGSVLIVSSSINKILKSNHVGLLQDICRWWARYHLDYDEGYLIKMYETAHL